MKLFDFLIDAVWQETLSRRGTGGSLNESGQISSTELVISSMYGLATVKNLALKMLWWI